MSILEVNHIKKVYKTRMGGDEVTALRDVHFSVEPGEFVAIMGESGSGKTTLLNILATLDKPTAGEVLLSGVDMGSIPEKQLAMYRRNNLGFVFQDFNLLDTFSLKDNIMLPLVLSGKTYSEMAPKMMELSRRLSIEKLLEKYPYEVSGGQKQRAAIARALITEPKIILADEPTGALDSHSSQMLLSTIQEMNEQMDATILMVTHDAFSASYANRILFLRDGEIYKEIMKGSSSRKEFFEQILEVLNTLGGGVNDVR